MSDYFDALIRASGLAADRPSAAAGSGQTTEDADLPPVTTTGLEELDVEHFTAPVVEAPVAPAGPSPVPVVPVKVSAHSWNEPVPSTPLDVVLPATNDIAERRSETSAIPAAAPATGPAPAPPQPGPAVPRERPAIVSSHERIVAAALEWVAADPMRLAIPQTVAPGSPAAPPPSTGTDPPHIAPPRSRADEVRPEPGPPAPQRQTRPPIEHVKLAPRPTPGEPPSMAVTPHAQASIPSGPIVAAERAAPRSAVDHRPLTEDEVIEVSIGAIHLRVDAPAPPPVTAAPPAPRTPMSANRPARDGLRRRALRRI